MVRKIYKKKQSMPVNVRVCRFRQIQNIVRKRKQEIFDESDQMYSEENNDILLKDLLRCWVNCYGITTRAVNDLLRILNKSGISHLPKDYRTLLQTPKNVDIIDAAGGKYWYYGIEKNLRNIFPKLDRNMTVELNINIDGLPIFKSSQEEFWPILSNIHGMPNIHAMVIAIWCGKKKPSNLEEYFRPFVNEMNYLLKNGCTINNYHMCIKFRCCLCDSPARALVKGTVNFNHTYGCQKCIVQGKKSAEAKRMFYADIDCALRTDDDFRARTQAEHHKTYSILEELPIDMIKSFPTSDPLHLLELGVMKKLLLKWKFGDVGYTRKFFKRDLNEMNTHLRKLNKDKPREIHRALRDFECLKFWKGTEFRSFLLYYGMVVLKDHLPSDVYDNFIILVCACRICYSNVYAQYLTIAKIWFDRFIEECIDLYGMHSITSNFHNLTHVCDDVQRFGDLNQTSCYPFENRLGFLKSRIKQRYLPLEQITRRIIEISMDYDQLYSYRLFENESFPKLDHPEVVNGTEVFTEISLDFNFCISAKKKADSWVLTFDDKIVQMKYVAFFNNDFIIHGTPIINQEDFFLKPVSSRYLKIFKSNGEMGPLISFSFRNIKAKMISLTKSDEFIYMPLMHTLKN